jgi:murein DD-endopeptidase MepM/ murein hydrolase activator NlpD
VTGLISPTPTPTPTPTPPTNSNQTPTIPGNSALPGPPKPTSSLNGTALNASTAQGSWLASNPLLGLAVNQILQNRLSAQHPDLQHFPAPSPSPSDSNGTTSVVLSDVPPSPRGGLPLGIIIPAIIVVAILLLRVGRARPMLTAERGGGSLLLIILVPTLGGIAGSALQSPPAIHAHQSTVHIPAGTAGIASAASDHQVFRHTDIVQARWNALVSIEHAINSEQDAISGDEAQIAAVAAVLQQTQDGTNTPDAGSPSQRGLLRPNMTATLVADLGSLVADHTRLVATYHDDLAREYEFYVGVAQSPVEHAAIEAAAAQATSTMQGAVQSDLSLVQTQLAQEASISAATAPPVAASPAIRWVAAPRSARSGHALTLRAPLSGVVSQVFGPTTFSLEPPITYRGVFYPHFHTGLDLAAPLDTPVGAAADGLVLLATSSRDVTGQLVGYGNYVVIGHSDGTLTVYGHLDKLLVSAGQNVQQGQVLGLCGSTGWSTGPHVHFEMRVGGEQVDPTPYLGLSTTRSN